jgi:ParB family chromosome partitioning protein
VIALFGTNIGQKRVNSVVNIPIAKIKPNARQPRKYFDKDALLELAKSIMQNGILQPLTIRNSEDNMYELIAGERRLRAALMSGLTQVPCIVIEADDNRSAVLSLLENLQRQDLNFFEEAEGIAKLIEYCGQTQDQVASSLGKTQSTIANKLRLLRLNQNIRSIIIDSGLTERHARAMLRLGEGERTAVLKQIISNDLNVSDTEKLVELLIFPGQTKPDSHTIPIIKDVRIFLNTITNAVNVMKKAGIDAVAVKQEFPEYYEYTVRIPKAASKAQTA